MNAGLYGENAGRVAIVRTAGHELTHYIQENAPELYEDLKSFLVDHLLEWKGKSLSELINEKLARDTTGKLDFDGALDEVVADGCEMMLKRSSVVNTLARENPSLFDRIHDWLKEWAAKIRKAFSGVEAYHEEAKAMLDYMDQLQKIWDKALTEAARNAADVRTETKTAADNGGRVQLADRENPRNVTTKKVEKLAENCLYGKYDDNTYIPVRAHTPQILIDEIRRDTKGKLILKELPFIMSVEHVRQDVEADEGRDMAEGKRPHNLDPDDFAAILEKADDPSRIVLQKNGRYAEIINYKTRAGKRFVASIEIGEEAQGESKSPKYMNGYEGGYYYTVVTVYAPDSMDQYYKKHLARIIYDKNDNSQSGSRSPVPSHLNESSFSDTSIRSSSEKSNPKNSERDAEYMEAVNNGNTAKAQRMVDEAARQAGYTKLFYHGSKKGGGFTVFKDWQYFTENKDYAMRYTQRDNPGSLYTVYAKMEHPFDTRDAEAAEIFAETRQELGLGEIQESGLPDWTDGYDLSDYIDENELPYDSIILDEGGDLVDGKPVSRGLSYVIKDSSQVKSADAITKDDNGKVIPLSQRFDKGNRDIRYQERDFIPDDRQLLMEAASKRGSSAELKAYSRKVKQLDTLQHKLERQQAVLAEAEEQDKAATRKAISKTEQQIERAENALAKMEASPALKAEARSAMAAWREANPNQAAETLRRLREVNRALEKDLAYWKGQAERTEPGENSVRPEDVRR